MNKDILIYFIIFLNILVADTHWVFPFILPSVLFIWPIFFLGIGTHYINIGINWKLVKPFFIFITYLLFVKITRQEDMIVTFYVYISQIITITATLYLREQKSKFLVWFFVMFVSINLGVQIIQMGGLHITAGKLLSPLGFREYADVGLFDSTRGFRYSGLFTNVVPLGFISGAATAYFWILYNQTKEKKHLFFAICAIMVSLFTNTRAVIYSIVPVILIVNYFIWRRMPLKLVFLGILFIVSLAIFQSNSGFQSDKSSIRISNWEKDGGVIDRIQGNVYGTVGTLTLNPLFGVSDKEQGKAIREGHKQLGLFIGKYFINHVTYHNLPLFYLRVYGIIGFLLFCFFYWSAIKYAYRLEDPFDREYMLTILFFFLLYNLSHNMKPDYLIFWMALLTSYKSYRDESTSLLENEEYAEQ